MRFFLSLLAFSWPTCIALASGWYFNERCVGDCASFFAEYSTEPAESDVHYGPFADEQECASSRDVRSQARESFSFTDAEGWSIGDCYFQQDEAIPEEPYKEHHSLFSGLRLGYIAGPGWTSTTANGQSQTGQGTRGADVELYMGRPELGVESSIGFQSSRFDDALPFVPVTVGLTSSPLRFYRRGALEVRPNFGASIAAVSTWGCNFVSSCSPEFKSLSAEIGARFRVGIDLYFSSLGVGLEMLIPLERLGDIDDAVAPSAQELSSPLLLFRTSFVLRSQPR